MITAIDLDLFALVPSGNVYFCPGLSCGRSGSLEIFLDTGELNEECLDAP
jgi:hypothetical protein